MYHEIKLARLSGSSIMSIGQNLTNWCHFELRGGLILKVSRPMKSRSKLELKQFTQVVSIRNSNGRFWLTLYAVVSLTWYGR